MLSCNKNIQPNIGDPCFGYKEAVDKGLGHHPLRKKGAKYETPVLGMDEKNNFENDCL